MGTSTIEVCDDCADQIHAPTKIEVTLGDAVINGVSMGQGTEICLSCFCARVGVKRELSRLALLEDMSRRAMRY